MRTLKDLKSRIVRLLGEVVVSTPSGIASSSHDSDVLMDAIYSAYEAVLIVSWKRLTFQIPQNQLLVRLPDDVYRIEGIWDNENGSFLHQLSVSSGDVRASSGIWSDYPTGFVTLSDGLQSGGILYYAGRWKLPELDDDILEIPDFVHNALCLYSASYCLLPDSVSASGIRQYGVRNDSGSPEDNPVKRMSDYFLHRYDIEISNFPKATKGVK